MLDPVLVEPAESLPVSLAEAKAHLRVEVDDDDDLITGLIEAATAYLESILSTSLVTQTWRQDFSSFDGLWLVRAPVQYSPAASPPIPLTVTYYDSAGDVQTVDAAVYTALSGTRGPYVALNAGQAWPTSVYDRVDAVSVTYVAGYGATAEAVPIQLRLAIKMFVGHWFENRAAVAEGTFNDVPLTARSLYWPFVRHAG